MGQAYLEFGSQGGEDTAGELHPIVAVDLQVASEGGIVAMHQSLGNGGGTLVQERVEAHEAAESILAGQDIWVPCQGLRQGPNQVNVQDLLGVPLAGWNMDTGLFSLSLVIFCTQSGQF